MSVSVSAAYRDGLGRLARAPLVLLGAWLLTLLVALPLALALRGMMAQHLGVSLAAEEAAVGVNWDWWQEFLAQATGLGATLRPAIIGGAAPIANVSDLLDNRPLATVLAGAVGAWLVIWSFLSGGILDRYARGRALGSAGFFAAAGVHFFRFLRLGAIALLAYWAVFRWVHSGLFGAAFPWLTRDMTVEWQAFAVRAVLYAVFGVLLVGVNLVLDYARIRIVVEDRHGAIGALAAAARLVVRNPVQTIGLYALNAAGFLLVVAAYATLAPGARGGGWRVWTVLAGGQLYILARLAVKLQFYASQTALFQRVLAAPGYAAAPVAPWPEPPVAEALRPAAGDDLPLTR
jgi:hypothetical protein